MNTIILNFMLVTFSKYVFSVEVLKKQFDLLE